MTKLTLVGYGLLGDTTFNVPDCAKVGRADDADVRLPYNFISRHHCTFFQLDGQWYVQDAGSLNGTYLNEQVVDGATLLCEGDSLRLGGLGFFVQFDSAD